MSVSHHRVILSAYRSLEEAQAEADRILAPHVHVVAVQLPGATRPVAFILVPVGYPCPACERCVNEPSQPLVEVAS